MLYRNSGACSGATNEEGGEPNTHFGNKCQWSDQITASWVEQFKGMEEKNKQMMEVESSKGMSSGQSDEHQRAWSEHHWERALKKGNYDRSREKLNFEITKGGKVKPINKNKRITERIMERFNACGIKDPNAGKKIPTRRTVVNVIFGGSRERMHEIAFGNQRVDLSRGADNSHITRATDIESWAKDMYQFACDQWGEDNVVGFYVHLDETNPHAHCTVLPITADNKLSYKKVLAGKDKFEYSNKMLALHSALAVVNERWGLERGSSVAETGAKHRSTEEYRRELSKKNTWLESEIKANQSTLSKLYEQIRLAERRVKGLTTMINNLEKQESDVRLEIAKLVALSKAGEEQSAELQEHRLKLEQDLVDVISKIEDKKEKLQQAEHILTALQNEVKEETANRDETRREVNNAVKDMSRQIKLRLVEAGFDEIVDSFRYLFGRMTSTHDSSLFDNSFVQDIAERGNEIIICASFLFAGLVDQATTFAQTHGGGGGGSDLAWGKRGDEDEQAWARRCMRIASKMMKPATSTKRKI